MGEVLITKSNGEQEAFDEKKLLRSLQKSGASIGEIEQTIKFVKAKVKKNMSTADIYALAYKNLNAHKKRNPNAIRYSLKKSVMELGPTGFPFEKFVSRIFNELGYKTETGVMIKGNCIEHEIDVFAYNDTEVICIEAKFHNEPHLRSDTKVALYVKARFDDLMGQKVKIGEEYRNINKGILITNTNFTDTAHQYVSCVGTFDLISWNKPNGNNLVRYIEDHNLYPIGVLNELSQKEIELLYLHNIMTCIDLYNNPEILNQIEMKKSKQELVLETVKEICAR